MYTQIFIPIILSFFVTLIITYYWIKRATAAGLTGKDMHKLHRPEIAELGGVAVILGFLIGVLFYIGMETFFFHQITKNLDMMSALGTVLIATVIAFIDDILGWKVGLKQWQKPLALTLAAVPLAVVNSGVSTIALPFFGLIHLGTIFPVIFIPLAVTGTANGFNMLAGYNGLETGMGIILLTTLGFVAWLNKASWVTIVAFCMVAALIAFYISNKPPAKVFPGNILTYSVGALIAVVAIMGNMERIALLLFTPYFIEFILKARGRFKKESFAKVLPDGSLIQPHNKFYGLEHIAVALQRRIRGRAYEREVTYTIFLIELIIIALVFLLML